MGEERKIMAMKTLEEITKKVEHVNYHYTQAEKRVKALDKEVAEYKIKADGMSEELMISQTQCRNATAELFRIKNGYDDAQAKLKEQYDDEQMEKEVVEKIEDLEMTKIKLQKQDMEQTMIKIDAEM